MHGIASPSIAVALMSHFSLAGAGCERQRQERQQEREREERARPERLRVPGDCREADAQQWRSRIRGHQSECPGRRHYGVTYPVLSALRAGTGCNPSFLPATVLKCGVKHSKCKGDREFQGASPNVASTCQLPGCNADVYAF